MLTVRLIFLSVALSANAAMAASVNYQFQAAVSLETRNDQSATVDQRFFSAGDLVSGTFSYDASVVTGFPGPNAGTFYPPPAFSNLSGSIAGNNFSDPGGAVGVLNDSFDSNPVDPNNELVDFVIMLAATPGAPANLVGFEVVNGVTTFGLANVRFFWIEGATDLFDDETLPAALPPGSGATARLALDFQDVNNPNNIHRVFADPLVVSAVPVPAAFWLFSSAMAMLGWVGARRKLFARA
jgi:hypothetical protein